MFDTDRRPTVTFPRIADFAFPKLAATAGDYDPFSQIDFDSLNLVYLTHETTLTAISSDRIRRLVHLQ